MKIAKPTTEQMNAARNLLGDFKNITLILTDALKEISDYEKVVKRESDRIDSAENISDRTKSIWGLAKQSSLRSLAQYKIVFLEAMTFPEEVMMGEGTYSETARFFSEYVEISDEIDALYLKPLAETNLV